MRQDKRFMQIAFIHEQLQEVYEWCKQRFLWVLS